MKKEELRAIYKAIENIERNENLKIDEASKNNTLYSPYSKQWAIVAKSYLQDMTLQCEPSECLLLSKPPQLQCKNCGRTFSVGDEVPTCPKDPLV